MSAWTSLDEIMQDLSIAQGYVVPASLETFGGTGPPSYKIKDESENESYYESGGGGGDFPAPDYRLIQEMLHMVTENDNEDDPSHFSDLDPQSPEFVPQHIKRKINRNVALSSILTAKENELAARRPIPKDVIPVMFKRKNGNHTEAKSKNGDASPTQVTSPDKYHQYVPTTLASQYYSKYIEKSKLKEHFEGDIWTRAEKQMKEIEARKKREAELASPQSGENSLSPRFGYGSDTVNLRQHRHRLSDNCVVCSVVSKHGYEIED